MSRAQAPRISDVRKILSANARQPLGRRTSAASPPLPVFWVTWCGDGGASQPAPGSSSVCLTWLVVERLSPCRCHHFKVNFWCFERAKVWSVESGCWQRENASLCLGALRLKCWSVC